MKMFWMNILRGAVKNRGSYIGATCIIAFGIFFYIGMMDTKYNLEDLLSQYYEESNFSDIFAAVTGISEERLQGIEDIEGINLAFGRLAKDVRIMSDQQTEIVTVHLMAYSAEDKLNLINLKPDQKISSDELYLGKSMKQIYGYEAGDTLQLLIGGNIVEFTLSGECFAPEYIYLVPSPGLLLTDPELYDIACVDKEYLEEQLDMRGLVNELGFTLEPGYTFDDVRYELMDYLEPYGIKSLCERKDQASFKTVDDEINALVLQAVTFMVIFMGMSLFMLYVVLKKIVDQDRTMIGTAKAMGFHNRELMLAYLWQGILIGVIGVLLASILAVPFGRAQLSLYTAFYNLPNTEFTPYWKTRIIGFFISVFFSILAVYSGVRGISKITPAEAMRSAGASDTKVMKFPQWLIRRLHIMHKMGLRSMVRNPMRTFVIALAIAFPFGCSAVLFSYDGMMEQAFIDPLIYAHPYDIQVSLDGYVPYNEAVSAGLQLDGVVSSEAAMSFYVQLTNNNLIQHVILNAYEEDSNLNKIIDWNKVEYTPPDDGLILNQYLADKLKVEEGDVIEIYSSLLLVKPIKIPIERIIQETVGNGCYLSAKGIRKYFSTDMMSNQIALKVRPGEQNKVKDQLLNTSRVNAVVDSNRVMKSNREKVNAAAAMMNTFAMATVVCGMILINNILMINVRERRTEYGTLKVLGVTREEFRSMIIFEQIVNFLLGIILGVPILEVIRRVVKSVLPNETMNIRVEVLPSACIRAFILCLVILIGSSIVIIRKVDRIMPADILKVKE